MPTDPREMTTGEAEAFRRGWEAAIEAAAHIAEHGAEKAAPGEWAIPALEHAAACIRRLEPPR